jgi:phage baseplate assembly protein W
MIPTGGSITNKQIVEVQRPSRTYRIDLKKGRIIGWADGSEAVKQAVFKILQTERFRYLIYDSDYGCELANLIGRDPLFVKSELRRRITEALMQDDRIDNVTDFEINIAGDVATVRFTVVSAFGSFKEEVTTRV